MYIDYFYIPFSYTYKTACRALNAVLFDQYRTLAGIFKLPFTTLYNWMADLFDAINPVLEFWELFREWWD